MSDVLKPFGPTVLWHIRAALAEDPPPSLRAITCAFTARHVALRCIFTKTLTAADKAAIDSFVAAISQALPRLEVDLECLVRPENEALGDLKLTEWAYTRLG